MKIPDRWVILKITTPEETYLKLFSTWFGGYVSNDSWRLNSGITEIVQEDNNYIIYGNSDTVYKIYSTNTGTSSYTGMVLKNQILSDLPKDINVDVLLDIEEAINLLKGK